jgi:hypothetical protein
MQSQEKAKPARALVMNSPWPWPKARAQFSFSPV